MSSRKEKIHCDVIELSKHIEILLLDHNCVIVPDLGGFVAQDMPARYIEQERLFLPPHRVVGFNPQLIFNDGLLVQSYMHAYCTGYDEALGMLQLTVGKLKDELHSKGEYELDGIGKLYLNAGGQYDFVPLEAGVLSPSLYGLDAVTVKKQQVAVQEAATEEEPLRPRRASEPSKHYTLNINRELVNYVAASVVAVFFYFLWATPLADSTTVMSAQEASMLFPQAIHKVAQPAVPAATLQNAVPVPAVEEAEAADDEAAVTADAPYTLVLASRIPERNAQRFVTDLQDSGLQEARVLKMRKIVRVVYGHYPSEQAAHEQLRRLRNQHAEFADAWVLRQS